MEPKYKHTQEFLEDFEVVVRFYERLVESFVHSSAPLQYVDKLLFYLGELGESQELIEDIKELIEDVANDREPVEELRKRVLYNIKPYTEVSRKVYDFYTGYFDKKKEERDRELTMNYEAKRELVERFEKDPKKIEQQFAKLDEAYERSVKKSLLLTPKALSIATFDAIYTSGIFPDFSSQMQYSRKISDLIKKVAGLEIRQKKDLSRISSITNFSDVLRDIEVPRESMIPRFFRKLLGAKEAAR